MIKVCPVCGKEFETEKEYKVFCCRGCKEKSRNRRRDKGISNVKTYTKICPICNKEFKTEIVNKIYCSDECYKKYLQEKNNKEYDIWSDKKIFRQIKRNIKIFEKQYIKELKEKQKIESKRRICPNCGKEFIAYKNQKYCCRKCASESNKICKDDICKILRRQFMSSLRKSLNEQRINKKSITVRHIIISKLNLEDILGCTFEEYKKYLESKFENGMNWNNYGHKKNQWQIDHIIPKCAFNFIKNNKVDWNKVYECFYYENTRPLWSCENYSKGREDRMVSCKKYV